MQKSLERDSDYNQYDMDGDGVVTDEELEHAKDIKKTETELRKNVAQLRMARYTLIFMGCYAVFLASPWCSAAPTLYSLVEQALSAHIWAQQLG